MINKNIVIAALARDCENSLRTNIPLLESFRNQIQYSQVIVVENDSIDGTKSLLNDWKNNYKNVTILSNDFETITIPRNSNVNINPMTSTQRIKKMVEYRNLYLDFIDKIVEPIDLLIVIDIDVLEISLEGMINAIKSFDEKTGAIFPNGMSIMKSIFWKSEIYYDIFAVWEYPLVDQFSYSPVSLGQTFKSINRKIKTKPLYPIISAFGGVGIYNYHAIKGLRYKNVLNPLNSLESICEHIPFNREIINRGFNNYIARDFKVSYGNHNWILILKLILPVKAFIYLFPILLKVKSWFNIKI